MSNTSYGVGVGVRVRLNPLKAIILAPPFYWANTISYYLSNQFDIQSYRFSNFFLLLLLLFVI